jgi:hypothetical protein
MVLIYAMQPRRLFLIRQYTYSNCMEFISDIKRLLIVILLFGGWFDIQ